MPGDFHDTPLLGSYRSGSNPAQSQLPSLRSRRAPACNVDRMRQGLKRLYKQNMKEQSDNVNRNDTIHLEILEDPVTPGLEFLSMKLKLPWEVDEIIFPQSKCGNLINI